MINQRLKKKYGYSIDQTAVTKILHQVYLQRDSKKVVLSIDEDDLQDVLFILKTKTDLYVKSTVKMGEDVVLSCIRLNDSVAFKTIKNINSENHPHIEIPISKGTILHYSEKPAYGVVNRYKGLPLTVGESFFQINYDYVELFESGLNG